MLDVQKQILFGCTLRSVSAQFGLNQNSTVYTVGLVREPGQECTLIKGSTSQMVNVSLGALNINGLVQSFDESIIDIAGSGIFNVRITDTKQILENTQVFLNSPININNLGDNIIRVPVTTKRAIKEGVDINTIQNSVNNTVLFFGNNSFRVDLNELLLPKRGIDNNYKIKGSVLSLMSLVQQITQDNGLDWFVETINNAGIFIIVIKIIQRNLSQQEKSKIVDIEQNQTIIRKNIGRESRNDVVKSVIVGAQRQFLSPIEGNRIKQFWGFDQNGVPFVQPQFTITNRQGQVRTIITDIESMRDVLNGKLTADEIGDDVFNSLKSFAQEFWGRKFFIDINPVFIDNNGESWIEPVSSAFWENETISRRPANFLLQSDVNKALDKFGTEDGRWTSFIELGSPVIIEPFRTNKWDDVILNSPNVILTSNNRIFMKITVERIKGRLIITLSVPLIVSAIRTKDNDICDQTSSTADKNSNAGSTRLANIKEAWVSVLDNRDAYGPFISEVNDLKGKTNVTIDNSIAPWTFGTRDISFATASQNMLNVANAKLKTIALNNQEIDTLSLDLVGLTTQNLGTFVLDGTNITNVSINFGVDKITTSYKARLFTNELSRQNKKFRDLLDELQRQTLLNQNTHFPEQNFLVLDHELNSLRKSGIEIVGNVSNSDEIKNMMSDNVPMRGIVHQRTGQPTELQGGPVGPFYNVTLQREVFDKFNEFGQPLTKFIDIKTVENVRNRAEKEDHIGRVESETIVNISRACFDRNILFFDLETSFVPVTQGIISGRFENLVSDHPVYTITNITPDPNVNQPRDLRFTIFELLSLFTVRNIGEPKGSQPRLPAQDEEGNDIIYNISWAHVGHTPGSEPPLNPPNILIPFMDVTVQLFRDPQ